MAKEKLAVDKTLKAFGAVGLEREGGKMELTIDPSKIPASRRRGIASGMSRAIATENWSSPFLPEFYEGNGNIHQASIHEKIKLAMIYFKSDPLVGRIVEVMAAMSAEGFKNEDTDGDRKDWYDEWCKAIEMDKVLDWIFLEWFRSGNVTIARELVQANTFNFESEGSNSEFAKAYAAKKHTYSAKSIPGAYTVLNPLTVYVQSAYGYNEELYMKREGLGVEALTGVDNQLLNIGDLKQHEMKNRIKELQGKIPLGKKVVSRVLRGRQPYEPYGSILMERAFNAMYEKNKLRQSDLIMLNSSITRLVKVTIGNDSYPATQAQLKKLMNAFTNVGKSQTIFWNHTLDIELIEPKYEPFKKARYERVDEDIRNAFGISEVLTGGGGGKANFATSYISLKVFITNMKQARKDVVNWLESQYKDIATAMGFDGWPTPTFSQLTLTDEVGEKQILMQLVDRGIISYETAQSALGYDPYIERERKKKEKPLVEKGLLGFIGSPYQSAIDKEAIDTGEESDDNVKKEDKKKVDQEDQKADQLERRHNQTGNPSKKVKDTRPKPGKVGDEGRPKTPRGNYPKNRQPAKGALVDPAKEFAKEPEVEE